MRQSVLLDFAALNSDEMLPWDEWGRMDASYKNETDTAYDELIDHVSAIVTSGDHGAIRRLYAEREGLRVPDALRAR